MTDSTEAVPDIIRDLLHPTPELRRKALKELKENWQKEFREYLWVAIEEEKTRSLQSQFVELATEKLEDHGLRKMIRYVESGQLFDGSRRIFIEAYCLYEDDLVREALIKSLKRPKSQTYKFVGKLLSSREFIHSFGSSWVELQPGTNRLHHQQSFFNEIMSQEIPIHARKEFAAVVFWMNLKDKKYYLSLLWLWTHHIRPDPEIHQHILGLFFPNDLIQLDRTANITNISDVELLWQNWTSLQPLYTTGAEDRLLITSHQDIQLSLMAVQSASAPDAGVRKLAMNILAAQQVNLQDYLPLEQVADYDKFMAAWDEIFREDLEDYLLEYFLSQSYLPKDLSRFSLDPEQNERVRSITSRHGVSHMKLAEAILLLKPRQVLYRLLDNDPVDDNRALAYSYLKTPGFWAGLYPIGPVSLWADTLRKSLRSFRFETSAELTSNAKELIYHLLDTLDRQEDHGGYTSFIQQLREMLLDPDRSTVVSELELLQDTDQARAVILKLRNYLFDEPLVIDHALSISPEDQLLNQLLASIEDRTNLFSILNLFQGADDETRLYIINYYYDRLEDDRDDFALNQTLENHLHLLLEQARDDPYIRVRTTAQLLASNGNIPLLPTLFKELSKTNLEYLFRLVQLAHAPTNQRIFQTLASRLRRLRSDDHPAILRELIQLGYQDDDMQTQKLASQCAKYAHLSI